MYILRFMLSGLTYVHVYLRRRCHEKSDDPTVPDQSHHTRLILYITPSGVLYQTNCWQRVARAVGIEE